MIGSILWKAEKLVRKMLKYLCEDITYTSRVKFTEAPQYGFFP